LIKGLLFDFDGTLIDTMFSFQKLAGKLINRYYPDIPVDEAEQLYFETSGIAFVMQMELIKPHGPHNKICVEEFEKEKLNDVLDEKFDEDVRNTFSKIQEMDLKLGISSGNYTSVIEDFLSKEKVKIEYVMGHEKDFEKGKAHFEYFMKKTGLTKKQILFCGDSLKDGERAHEFGIRFIAKEGIFKKERFQKEFGTKQVVIAKISEILNFLD
jgi:FMN phosphatase YigB (HAD superfamily)